MDNIVRKTSNKLSDEELINRCNQKKNDLLWKK